MDDDVSTDFLTVPLNRKSMHIYYVRNAILDKLKAALPFFRGTLLDVGCGHMPYKSTVFGRER